MAGRMKMPNSHADLGQELHYIPVDVVPESEDCELPVAKRVWFSFILLQSCVFRIDLVYVLSRDLFFLSFTLLVFFFVFFRNPVISLTPLLLFFSIVILIFSNHI